MPEIRCPICKKPSRPSEPYFPFCSKRCKMVDLGSWLDERYRICRPLGPAESAGGGTTEEPEEETGPPPSDPGRGGFPS